MRQLNLEVFYSEGFWWLRVPTRGNTTTWVTGTGFRTAGSAVDYAVNTYTSFAVITVRKGERL